MTTTKPFATRFSPVLPAETQPLPMTEPHAATFLVRPTVGINEVLAILRVSRCTVWRWMKMGRFPRGGGIGHRRRWYRDEVIAWRDAQMVAGPLPGHVPSRRRE